MAVMPVGLDRRSLACAEQAWCEGDTLHCRNQLYGKEFVCMFEKGKQKERARRAPCTSVCQVFWTIASERWRFNTGARLLCWHWQLFLWIGTPKSVSSVFCGLKLILAKPEVQAKETGNLPLRFQEDYFSYLFSSKLWIEQHFQMFDTTASLETNWNLFGKTSPSSLSVHIFSSIPKDNALLGSCPICSAVWHYCTGSFEEVLTAARSRITALLAHCLTIKLQHPFSKLFVFHFCPVFRLSSLVKLCAERCFMTNRKPRGSALKHQGEKAAMWTALKWFIFLSSSTTQPSFSRHAQKKDESERPRRNSGSRQGLFLCFLENKIIMNDDKALRSVTVGVVPSSDRPWRMAAMQAHRGVIYDSCRLGPLSQSRTSPATQCGAIQRSGGDKPDRL